MRSTSLKSPTDEMWRVTLALYYVALATGIVAVAAFRYRAPVLMSNNAVLFLVSAVGIAVLSLRKKRKSLALANFLWLALVATSLFIMWNNHDFYVLSERKFNVFAGVKFIAILVCLFAPPTRWVGFTSLAVAGLVTLIRYYTWPIGVREALSIQEPWMTAIFIAAAYALYFHRLKSLQLQREAALFQAKAEILQRFAHLLINAQHLVNTPLQTIQNTAKILRVKHPETAETLQVLDRSLIRVREIVELFSQFDSYVSWKELEMPDTIEEFRKQAKELLES
jgi:hypothetical protein